MNRTVAMVLAVGLAGALAGCVERTIKITSQPSGAVVYLNDEEVGRTPADVRFTWYGTYGVTLRREGYETLQAAKKIDPPVYQWPVIDVFTELLIPYRWHDVRTWDFEMQPQKLPAREELLERATEFRQEAGSPAATQPGVVDTQPVEVEKRE